MGAPTDVTTFRERRRRTEGRLRALADSAIRARRCAAQGYVGRGVPAHRIRKEPGTCRREVEAWTASLGSPKTSVTPGGPRAHSGRGPPAYSSTTPGRR